MKKVHPRFRLGIAWLAGSILLALTLPTYSDDYDTPCPICTSWDESAKSCVPQTTPPYSIPVVLCNHPINYIEYNSYGAGGYIQPGPPINTPHNLFVTNRCHNGIMKHRIEGKFSLWNFTVNVVDRFMITSGMCNWPPNTTRPRDPAFIAKSLLHELTHCATFATVINAGNNRVVNAGWFSTSAAANAKRQQIISETNAEWATARARAYANADVAGQIKTIIEGDCQIERQIGTW